MITLLGVLQAITFLFVCVFVIGMIVPKAYFPKSSLPRYKVFKVFGSLAIIALTTTLVWSSYSHNYLADDAHPNGKSIVILEQAD